MQDTNEMQNAQADSAPIQGMTEKKVSAGADSVCEASSYACSASSAQEENALPDSETNADTASEEEGENAAVCAENGRDAAVCEEDVTEKEASENYPVFPLDEDEDAYYERRAEEDMREVSRLFPELSPDGESLSIGELRNPARFAELREAGLSVEEAFLASNYRMLAERPRALDKTLDGNGARTGKTAARASIPRAIGRANGMPTALLLRSRAIFEGLSDTELASLYRRVTRE